MATTTDTALTSAWTKIVDSGDYIIQNNGNNPIFLFWKATEPATSDKGIMVMPGNGADVNSFGDGPVWARATKDVSSVAVNAL